MNILTPIMYYLDIFKSPLSLLFNRKRFISTKLGFFCSISIFSTLLAMLIKSDLFEKKLPQILFSNLPTPHRPHINFTNKIIAIGVQDDTYFKGYVDPSVFRIKVSNYYFSADFSGGYVKKTVEKKIHLCSAKDFDDQTFSNLGLENNFCIDKEDNNLELEGFYDESLITFASIDLFLCDNSTNNNTCKGFDEIKQSLNGKSFNIYFEDTIVDYKNYELPKQRTFVNKYQYIDCLLHKTIELNFQIMNLKSDDGWLFSNWTEWSKIGFTSMSSDFFTVSINDFNTSRFSFILYSDKNLNSIQRNYIKVSDLLARLGGVLQSLMFIAYIIIHLEHSLYLKNTILNALYFFQQKETKSNRKSNQAPFQTMNEAVELNKSCQNRQNLKFCESPKFFGNKENAKFDQIFSSNSRERSPKIYAKIPISKQTLNGFMLSSFHIMKKKII